MKPDPRGINHKPSNIRVISGAFDDYEVTSMDYSFKSANDDILLDIVEESQEEHDDIELESLLKQFIQGVIVKELTTTYSCITWKSCTNYKSRETDMSTRKTNLGMLLGLLRVKSMLLEACQCL